MAISRASSVSCASRALCVSMSELASSFRREQSLHPALASGPKNGVHYSPETHPGRFCWAKLTNGLFDCRRLNRMRPPPCQERASSPLTILLRTAIL